MIVTNNRHLNAVISVIANSVSVVTGNNVEYEDILFLRKKKPISSVSIAKSMAITILHDEFGYSYTIVSKWFGIHTRSCMRCAEKCRTRMYFDRLYKEIYTEIDRNLTALEEECIYRSTRPQTS